MIDFSTEATKQFKRRFRVGRLVTGEDIRVRLQKNGVKPKSPNSWGPFVQRLIRENLLTPTNDYVPMQEPTSHGRYTQVYEVSR